LFHGKIKTGKNWKKLEKPNKLSTVKCTHTGIIDKRRKL